MNPIKKLSLLFTLLLCLSVFMSCNGDDDASPDTVLPSASLTIYTGTLTYTSSTGNTISNNSDATATIELDGNTYNINFSDNVPSISGLAFVESNGSYATTSDSNVTGISLEGDDLAVGSTQDGNTWAFSGSK